MLDFVNTIIQERQENGAAAAEEDEDLLDVLLRLQKEVGSEYPLTTLNIIAVIIVSSLYKQHNTFSEGIVCLYLL
jgi:hypothetical protein